jgi:hypothetical protein
MPMDVSQVGLRAIPVAGVTTPVSINASTTITLPTGAQRIKLQGTLECYLTIEGTVTSRYTFNGTVPTAAIGQLLPAPTATTPVTLTIIGEDIISNFKIIGTASGNTITYQFGSRDVR